MRGNLLSDTILFITAGFEQKARRAHLNSAFHLKISPQTLRSSLSNLNAPRLERPSFVPVSQSPGGVWVRSAQWFSDLMLRELIQLLSEAARSKTRLNRSS